MTNNDELAMQAEQCANILENISGFEPDDIDGDAVDLRFDLDGMDTGCTVSLVEQCQHAADALRALLAERDADKKVIAERAVLFETLRQEVLALERDVDAANARVDTKCAQLCNQDEEIEMLRLRIAELEARTVSVQLPDEFYTIADNIRTQDNRITSEPMFCVYQKREIAVDSDCDYDRIVWVDEDGNEASEHKSARLELLHENFREPPDGWHRVAVKDVDDFVTCCFTERGCKDYLACNGHNLRLPFIYVKSGFRNAEYISIRNWLAGIKLEVGEV